ncbi:MAG: type II secretion system F family protein [Candidatus Nanopelagicales bacterium]
MNLAAAAVTAGTLAGISFMVSGARLLRPDPLRRAMSWDAAHANGELSPLDRTLAVWNDWMGVGRQQSCLVVLERPATWHRMGQIRAMIVALAGSSFLALAGIAPIGALLATVVGVATALLVTEKALHRAARRRRAVLADQVLLLAEFLALCLTAGVTAAEALQRSASRTPQPLSGWIDIVVRQVRAGRPLDEGLTEVARILQLPEFDRLADSIRTAAERGVPVAAVVSQQVRDERGRRRAADLERAGRADMAMLVPVVMLILPAVVVVAVYPGFVTLLSM